MKKRIYAFDFDGTLTTRDTLIAFIRYAKGTRAFVLGFLLHAHLLVLTWGISMPSASALLLTIASY